MSLPFSKIRTFILGLAVLILVGGIGYRIGQQHPPKNSSQNSQLINTTPTTDDVDFSLFWDVWSRIKTYSIDAANIDTQKMVYGAIAGAVSSLDDPFTTFFTPKENTQFKEDLGGSFQGIGAQLELMEGKVIIQTPLKGSPAEKAGLLPLDWIVKVDGKETTGWSLQQAVDTIRGKKGTTVTLTVLHDKAAATTDVAIVRDEIVIPSVESWIKAPQDIKEISGIFPKPAFLSSSQKIGYLSLSRFGDRTETEWLTAVDLFVKQPGIAGLVFDLRNNPGGYLDGAVFIASEFLKKGVVVTQQNSDGSKDIMSVNRSGKLIEIPMIVLVNKGSASAAEIVAGALKDYKRATIVGQTSFGKGSVQTPQELTGGASVHITTGKWLLPNGEWINKKGITPDVEVKLDTAASVATQDAQLAKAIELLLR